MVSFGGIARKIFGSSNERRVKGYQPRVQAINALEGDIQALSDEALKAKTGEFRQRLESGEELDALLPEAFAVVREASKRVLGMRPFDVQLIGGMVQHEGAISEMRTGEGKTLVATLPAYLNALGGKGVHVVTVNDYLAKRDAEWMGQIYNFLGMSVSTIVHGMDDEQRQAAYAADITYATNNELGFDYLRDNMKYERAQMVQRGHNFAIIDEVDSILIDEARTPLIISGPLDDRSELYVAIDKIIPHMQPDDFTVDEKQRTAVFTEEGTEKIEQLLAAAGHIAEGSNLYDIENVSIVHHVNNALKAHTLFQRDKDYIKKGDEIVIIDEFTGRQMPGRRFSEGLHQALEAKEGASIQPENQTLASVTFQNYFRMYEKLAGMTGTANTEAEEFANIYGLEVIEIPTNLPVKRVDEDDEVYRTVQEKYDAVILDIIASQLRGQPVLVGTTSIEKSELISTILKEPQQLKAMRDRVASRLAGIKEGKEPELRAYFEEAAHNLDTAIKQGGVKHDVLNARQHEREAHIVSQAGVPGTVTIATNMAGRGTDIKLGGNAEMRIEDETAGLEGEALKAKIAEINADIETLKQQALEAGGLYVLATERHESRRIDNQLRGRSGRQGDPGRSKFYLSLQDDLMRIFGSERMDGMLQKLGLREGEAIVHPWINKALEKAQKKVEARNFDIRKNLLKYDDVMNDQRKVIFEQRLDVMDGKGVSEMVTDMRHEVIDTMIADHIPEKSYPEQWDMEGMHKAVMTNLNMDVPVKDWAMEEGVAEDDILERLTEVSDKYANERAERFGPEITSYIEKSLILQTLDELWREHLVNLDHLRSAVGFRGYAQRDPLQEYKSEAFELFQSMLTNLRQLVTQKLMRVEIVREGEQDVPPAPQPVEMHEVHDDAGSIDHAGDAPAYGAALVGGAVAAEDRDPNDESTWGKVQRNEACPCGSGKKYKHCHGAYA